MNFNSAKRVPSDKLNSSRFQIRLIRHKRRPDSKEVETKLILRNNGQLDFEK